MTAKVEEEEGSIIQISIVILLHTAIKEYKLQLYELTRMCLGWFYTPEVIQKVYIE